MARYFNITGSCSPQRHYMVNLDSRVAEIKRYVDEGKYFTINRGRQYGKTTTINALARYLKSDYIVVSMDFQMQMSDAKFRTEESFSKAFAKGFLYILEEVLGEAEGKDVIQIMRDSLEEEMDLVDLFFTLRRVCAKAGKPIVLIIDEVDSASNNQVFLDFLAQLRGYYLKREQLATFQSVILAGVHDIKNLRQKIRPDEEHRRNSPWNIASSFDVEMNFSSTDIESMLKEYEKDHSTGMDISGVSQRIYDYTSGYPVLVSWICKIIDEKGGTWDGQGVVDAVKKLLAQSSPLFESLINKLEDSEELQNLIYRILFNGQKISFNPDDAIIGTAKMYGFVVDAQGTVAVANRIFEIRLYNWYISKDATTQQLSIIGADEKNQFIKDGHLDMELILEKFVVHFNDLYKDSTQRFKEDDGRKLFLLYLHPIINGAGNYYIEAQTRDLRRTDIIVDYSGEQFVVELKIWHGEEYNKRGEQQLAQYLDYYHIDKGYMVSFNFNKEKQSGVHTVRVGDKMLVEAVV